MTLGEATMVDPRLTKRRWGTSASWWYPPGGPGWMVYFRENHGKSHRSKWILMDDWMGCLHFFIDTSMNFWSILERANVATLNISKPQKPASQRAPHPGFRVRFTASETLRNSYKFVTSPCHPRRHSSFNGCIPANPFHMILKYTIVITHIPPSKPHGIYHNPYQSRLPKLGGICYTYYPQFVSLLSSLQIYQQTVQTYHTTNL